MDTGEIMVGINRIGYKPPTNGRKMSSTYCKGTCIRFKAPMPRGGRNPYATHISCTKCGGVWMERTSCAIGKNGALRCPCCNWLVRVKAKRKYGGETAKLYNKQSG